MKPTFFSTVSLDVARGRATSPFHHKLFLTHCGMRVQLQISALNPNSLTLRPNKCVPERLQPDVEIMSIIIQPCLFGNLSVKGFGQLDSVSVRQRVNSDVQSEQGVHT